MKRSEKGPRRLAERCEQQGLSTERVLRMLGTVQDYESKERRAGVYDALRDIITSRSGAPS
jgi:transcriptional regulator with XRE-family HTH domain